MQTIDVINDMLGTMGERPLVSLNDTHALLSAGLAKLAKQSEEVQAKGWWFNMELLTLTPSPTDSAIYLPNDCLGIRTDDTSLVKRGNRIYNLTGGTYVYTGSSLDLMLIRSVPFEDLPSSAAAYVAARAVQDFQLDYDGDTAKARDLQGEVARCRVEINTEHTRARHTNLVENNVSLQRLKSFTRRARTGIR